MANRSNTKKGTKKNNVPDMLPEYDFSKGVRGKHARAYEEGTNVVLLAPDVASEFRTSEEVNDTLRAVLRLIHRKNGKKKKSA